MAETQAGSSPVGTAPAGKLTQTYNRDNPFLSNILEKRLLTHATSSKSTYHLSLCLKDGDISYEPGDSCGVIAQNDPRLVEEILAAGKFTGAEAIKFVKQNKTVVDMSLLEALTHQLQVTRLSRRLLTGYANKAQAADLLALLAPEQQSALDAYLEERGLIDLLEEYPRVLTDPAELVALLPKLTPRLYSIASSLLAHPREVHTTVAVVRYRTNNRDRGGVATTFMADRTDVGHKLPIYIQANKRFRLPADLNAPIIMIGPGTGLAPFRAFLHERRMLGATGRNWLFFGDRSASTDFLYGDELEAMRNDGHLTRLDLAFSRDQAHKVYVQDRMLEQAAEFWRWLEQGASIYVCGDATRMAKDVDATLRTIVATQGSMDTEGADAFVKQLIQAHRYHRDVY